MKKSFIISNHVNLEIEVGDKVRLIDGSGVTHFPYEEKNTIKETIIIFAYPEQTKSTLPLKQIEAEVLEIGVKDYICTGYTNAYPQDIIIKVGDTRFRTPSGFVKKV